MYTKHCQLWMCVGLAAVELFLFFQSNSSRGTGLIILVVMWFARDEAEEAEKAAEIPSSEPALPTRQRWRELLSDFLKNEEAAINIVIILLVMVDVIAAVTFEAFIDVSCTCPLASLLSLSSFSHTYLGYSQEEQKDCFGRDSIEQTLISSVVLLLFVAELVRLVTSAPCASRT